MGPELQKAIGLAVTLRNSLIDHETRSKNLSRGLCDLSDDGVTGADAFGIERLHSRASEVAKVFTNYRARLEEDIRRLDPDALPREPEAKEDPLRDVLARAEQAREAIEESRAGAGTPESAEAIIATAPEEIQGVFNEYHREGQPFGMTQAEITQKWQALKTRQGSSASDKALEPLTASELILVSILERAVDWGRTKVIDLVDG